MLRHLLPLQLAAALVLTGCISSTVDSPLKTALQGTWSGCANDGTADLEERLTFEDDALRWKVSTFATADGSCGGAASVVSDLSGSFVTGEALDASLGEEIVVAQGIDVTDGTRTFYTTVYIDEATTPRTLYLGEADLSTGRDMTSGAKRPIVLSAWKPLTQQ